MNADAEFRAFIESLPDKHWSKYDLSAVRLGWDEAHKRLAQDEHSHAQMIIVLKLLIAVIGIIGLFSLAIIGRS